MNKNLADRSSAIFAVIACVVLCVSIFFVTKIQAAPTTFTVNSSADGVDTNPGDDVCETSTPGECTFRAAIEEANADVDTDTIQFNITSNEGSGPHTILPSSALPTIVSPVNIDATTETGFVANTAQSPNPFNGTMMIVLSGASVLSVSNGLTFDTGSDNSTVKGLVINNWTYDGISIANASNLTIRGNYIGSDQTGILDQGNQARGIGTSFNISADNMIVGGILPADRNLIIGNDDAGGPIGNEGIAIGDFCDNWDIKGNYIGVNAGGMTAVANEDSGIGAYSVSADTVIGGTIAGSANVISGNGSGNSDYGIFAGTNFTITGNYIGTDYTGLSALGNSHSGIFLAGSGSTVGGSTSSSANVISGNGGEGIRITADGQTVQRNYIGVGIDGSTAVGNGSHGIEISSSSNNLIGGSTSNQANTIANNGADGVVVSGSNSLNNPVIGNEIFNNIGLAIDLSNDDVTANDAGDSDTGPNDLLNFPELFDSTENAGNTIVNYKLDVPAGNYRVEIFSNSVADGSGNGEGESLLGFDTVTSNGSGAQTFNSTVSGVGHTNISMTATKVLGVNSFGPTSEFGAPASPQSDIEITKEVVDDNEPKTNGTITYNFTLTNHGPSSVDLSDYDGTGFNPLVTSLLVDIMPPELTYLSENSSNVNCISAGPGSASLAGSLFEDHITYSIVLCAYSGPSNVLTSGQSFNFQLKATVSSPLPATFTNYAFHISTSTDPDTTTINNSFGTGNDIINILLGNVNNFASAVWPVPVTPGPNPGSDNDIGSANNQPTNSLANTGQPAVMATLASIIVVLLTGVVMLNKRKSKNIWY